MAEQNFRVKRGLEVGNNGEVIITYITDDGFNVGIGSTQPTNKLSVVGDAFISENIGIGVTNPRTKLSFGESVVGFDSGKTSLRLFDSFEDTDAVASNDIGFGVNYFPGIGVTYLDIAANLNNSGVRIFAGLTSSIDGAPYERIAIEPDGRISIGTATISIGTTEIFGAVTLNNKLGFLNNIILGNDETAQYFDAFNPPVSNIIIGYGAVGFSTDTSLEIYDNIFIGNRSGYAFTGGTGNIFLGNGSGLYQKLEGNYNNIDYNTFIGENSGSQTKTSYNEFFGSSSGSSNVSGQYNLFLGSNTGLSSQSSYKILIGKGVGITTFSVIDPETLEEVIVEQQNTFDSLNREEDKQLAIGLNTNGTNEYWILGNNKFNVGIGTTILSEKLNIGGNIFVTGSIGVGTTNSGYKFDVLGDVRVSGGSTFSGVLELDSGLRDYYGNVGAAGSLTFNIKRPPKMLAT